MTLNGKTIFEKAGLCIGLFVNPGLHKINGLGLPTKWTDGSWRVYENFVNNVTQFKLNMETLLITQPTATQYKQFWLITEPRPQNHFVCQYKLHEPVVAPTPKLKYGCNDGWIYSVFTGLCYKVFSQKLEWESAQKQCQKSHGSLVNVNSREELTFLASKL